ncbi:MAG: hypothetical protein RRY34_10115, partial [Victivallaceae bacterium]
MDIKLRHFIMFNQRYSKTILKLAIGFFGWHFSGRRKKYYLIKANVHRYLWKNTFCVIIPYLIIAILFKSFFPIIMLMGFYFVLYVICAAIAEKIPNRPVAIIDCARRTLTIFRYPRATFIQTNNKITRIDLDKITGISTCWCWR